MRKLFLSFIVTCFAIVASAQSISQLDRDAGYKDLKLGTSISMLSNKLEYVQPTSSGRQMYKVTDPSYLDIFGVRMDDVTVFAFNGRVTGIYMVKRSLPAATLDPSYQEKIQTGFTKQYGKPQYDMTDLYAEPTRKGVAWKTSSKEAHVCTLYFSNNKQYSLTVLWAEFSE